tara:strand:+ start:857 stop:1330 length:474 start_codon:yes stop_codon:yes gene_type:complete
MEDIIWNRIKKLDSSDLNFIHYYKLDIELDYSDIESLYQNYISKYYFNDKKKESIFSEKDSADKISIKISIFEPTLAFVIEDIFKSSLDEIEDSLILFYFRETEDALLLFKSFHPLSEIEEVRLPHFCYYIKNKETIKSLNKQFRDGEKLCIMHCSN